jgi:sugar transferase (PEP-CTERM/EpsH1 system associated)
VHILWIKTEFLHPVDKGGRIRTYQMLRALQREHRVTYLTLDDGTAAPNAEELAREYADVVERVPFTPPSKGSAGFFLDLLRNVFSPLPYAVARYRSRALRDGIRELCAASDVDVVVCDFLAPSLNVPDRLGKPTVLFQHNVEAMIWERHATVAKHPVKRAYMRRQWQRMLRHEQSECARFDHVIAVSPEDAAVFRDRFGVPDVSHVPTGVDTAYFRPSGQVERQPHEIVFTGSMDWMPNVDAIRWFVDDILPLVRARVPDVTLSVVGRNPPASIRTLADDPAITVTGSVPDVRPYIERAAAFIVPIRIGGGTRLKIFEAMAMERPVVSTTIGAEGLPVRDGVDALLADTPEAFADAIIRLLLDPALASRIGDAAASAVRAEYGWDRVAARFADICSGVSTRLRSDSNQPAAAPAPSPAVAGAVSNQVR